MKKHMRLPNGFGRITYIKSGNLRNRYRAMITVGHDENGKPIGKILKPQGYFKTYNEAYLALVEYNKAPSNGGSSITLEELYVEWFDAVKRSSSPTYLRSIDSAWARVKNIRSMKLSDIRTYMLKDEIENADGSDIIKARMKSMFNLMYDFAVERECVPINIARNFSRKTVEYNNTHIAFTDSEMKTLWENSSDPYVKMILIQCYMGWRPQELCLITVDNVQIGNMDSGRNYIIGGLKTRFGKDRLVPIHNIILPFIESFLEDAKRINSEYLINCIDANTQRSSKMTYDKYRHRFENIINQLGLNPKHRAHDPRKHFITMCKKYKVDEYAIKKMVGHSITDITEKIYTQRDEYWLFNELNKLEGPKI